MKPPTAHNVSTRRRQEKKSPSIGKEYVLIIRDGSGTIIIIITLSSSLHAYSDVVVGNKMKCGSEQITLRNNLRFCLRRSALFVLSLSVCPSFLHVYLALQGTITRCPSQHSLSANVLEWGFPEKKCQTT